MSLTVRRKGLYWIRFRINIGVIAMVSSVVSYTVLVHWAVWSRWQSWGLRVLCGMCLVQMLWEGGGGGTHDRKWGFWAPPQNCEKRATNFIVSVRRSSQHETTRPQGEDFREIWHLGIFRNSFLRKIIQVLLKSDKNNGHVTWRSVWYILWCLILLRMRNVLDKSCGGNQNTFYIQ